MSETKVIMMDLDNTILDRNEGAYRTFRHFVTTILQIDPDTVYGESIVQDLMNWDGFGNIRKDFLPECLKRYYGIDLGDFNMGYWWFHHLYRFEDLYPQSPEVLDYLKKKYHLALITNGDTFSQSQKVERHGLRKWFEYVLISQEVGKAKPDPLMYQMTLEHFNVSPEEAVFVGDTFGKDILGACNVGIRPIWIWPEDGRGCLEGITRIRSIGELMDIL